MASAKTVKKSKKAKQVRMLEHVSVNILLVLAVGLVVLQLFLRSYNNSLSAETQRLQQTIAELNLENSTAKTDIQNLEKRDHVTEVAGNDGMTNDSDSVITISASTDSSSEESE